MISKFVEAGKETLTNPTGRWVITACALRRIGTNCLSYYSAIYFAKMYPENISDFGVGNAAAYLLIASFSNLAGGYLSDKLEAQNKMSKAYISSLSTAVAFPLIMVSLLQ